MDKVVLIERIEKMMDVVEAAREKSASEGQERFYIGKLEALKEVVAMLGEIEVESGEEER